MDAYRGEKARLIGDLLQGYDRDAKPVKNASDAVTVKLTMTYIQLQDLVSILSGETRICPCSSVNEKTRYCVFCVQDGVLNFLGLRLG